MTPEQFTSFKEVTTLVVKWLQQNGNPHMKIIIEQDGTELVQGISAIYIPSA